MPCTGKATLPIMGRLSAPTGRPVRAARPFLHVLLALLLMFSQQAGFAHALSHLSNLSNPADRNGQAAGADHGKKTPPEDRCAQCLAFAHLGASPPAEGPRLPAVPADEARAVPTSPASIGARPLRAFQSRAPPR